ncbi:unnamed protein product [Prunus armeniaca]
MVNRNGRDIVVETISGRLWNVQDCVGFYDPLQYPLLLPYGTYGWDINTHDDNGRDVSCCDYYSYMLQPMAGDGLSYFICTRPGRGPVVLSDESQFLLNPETGLPKFKWLYKPEVEWDEPGCCDKQNREQQTEWGNLIKRRYTRVPEIGNGNTFPYSISNLCLEQLVNMLLKPQLVNHAGTLAALQQQSAANGDLIAARYEDHAGQTQPKESGCLFSRILNLEIVDHCYKLKQGVLVETLA